MYGTKFIILIEIKISTITSTLIEDENTLNRAIDLFIIEEKRNKSLRRILQQKKSVIDYYKVVYFKSFSLGHLVLRKVFPNKEWMIGKLGTN